MKELSIFIDESGDAGPVSKYYIVTLVFHEQDKAIEPCIKRYEQLLGDQSLDIMPFHFGPLLTGHDDYKWQEVQRRKKQLSAFTMLVQHLPITYHCHFRSIRPSNRNGEIRAHYNLSSANSQETPYQALSTFSGSKPTQLTPVLFDFKSKKNRLSLSAMYLKQPCARALRRCLKSPSTSWNLRLTIGATSITAFEEATSRYSLNDLT